MSLQIGIVGLPNVGKSTLFNALTRAQAAVASYPFTTIDPNLGVAEVPDDRLSRVAEVIRPKRAVPAAVEFVDIAGLVKGASRGEGLGNQFLSHIRAVDAIALVLRCFEDPDIPHQFGEIDPLLDIETIHSELILADIQAVERRIEKVRGAAKANPRLHAGELDFLERLHAHLNSGRRAVAFGENAQETAWMEELNLLSAKPQLWVANVSEDALPDGGNLAARARERAQQEGVPLLVICAVLEADLAQMDAEEARQFREELGLGEPGLALLAKAGYTLLNLITFFTATGTEEVRAWPLRAGLTAWDAAGKIHTDMQRGFIRAEVIPWHQLAAAGSWAEARAAGWVRTEGREYIVQDGDVLHIRFAV